MIGTKFQKPVQDWKPYSAAAAWCNENGGATIEDKGEYYEVVEVKPYVPTKEEKEKMVRAQRDAALTASDWVVTKALEAGEEVPEEWKTYRQALRDITMNKNFPDVELPKAPDAE